MDALAKLKTLKTLLVDDDPFIRDAMKLAFKRKQFSLCTADTAEEALKAMHAESFDVIISDFKLPGISGLTFLKQAAAAQPGSIKVLISATGSDEEVSEAYRIGADDFLPKPFTLETLLATLRMHLGKGQRQEAEIFENAALAEPVAASI